MNEQGHFVLEAVIGLAIAGLLLMGAYQLAGNSLAVHRRTEAAHSEALALSQIRSCFPRLRYDLPASGPLSSQPECADFEIVESRMLTMTLGSSRIRQRTADGRTILDLSFLVLQR